MTFKNNKCNSYYLSNSLSDIPKSPFQNSRKGCRYTKAMISSKSQIGAVNSFK